MARSRIEPSRLEPERELACFREVVAGHGAVVSFVGSVRPTASDGVPVLGLFLDHYPGLTEASLAGIAADAEARFAGAITWVVHRAGEVASGEPIVFAAAASPHRRLAFEAADYLMDRLKTEAAFWKREERADGARWIEPTAQDRADRERWR